ncbi:MAG TPA: DNA-formamidopyrimidine glycosylase family protein, partial [Clostridia bacterium]|nr:DNA-formamidopyrimidine glycosylase family protein [Clostridia bacterium]
MPELPEVEVLVRHLKPLLEGQTITEVHVRRPKILAPTTTRQFGKVLRGATFTALSRRGKFLLFHLKTLHSDLPVPLLGHLGMTGRMYLLPAGSPLPKHAVVVMNLGKEDFVFEDTRYFGRMTLDITSIEKLGPEPLGDEFTPEHFGQALQRSTQPIKVKLLDQTLVAGVGNIYASEALFRAGISPRVAARRLNGPQVQRLWQAIREVLTEAIKCGSTLP